MYCSLIGQSDSTRRVHRNPPPPDNAFSWNKFFYGGYVGAQFGTATFVEISPIIGYRFTQKISGGVGLTYQYYHYQDSYYNIESNVYGGRIFGRYYFIPNLFAHVEYEYLNLQAYDYTVPHRVGVVGLLVGGGYFQPLTRNAGMMAMILFNLNESYYTPYQNPVIRLGFVAGF
jgi:hypothetical protein